MKRSFLAAFWPFIVGAMLVAGGLAAIVIGYFGVSGTIHVGLQIPYVVSGGLLGLALVVAGSALLVLHWQGRQTRLLLRLLEEVNTVPRPEPVESDGPSANGMVLVAKGARTFHEADCLLVKDKQTSRMRPRTAVSRGLTPCRVCEPA